MSSWGSCLMGREDGWDELDGPEKCPLNFIILCVHIDYVCIKIAINILMGFKISCQVGSRGQEFQDYVR